MPNEEMRLSDKGKKVLQDRESLELEAYLDSKGILTIGIGHTSAAGPPRVYQGMKITEKEAWEIFARDSLNFRKEALKLVKVKLAQHEFDALASFIHNIGTSQFRGSTFLKRLNSGDRERAAEAMLWWNKPPEVMNRRRGEHAQFKHGHYIARIDARGDPA